MKEKELDKMIVRCWKNGWYVNNIAHITGSSEQYIKEVLKHKGFEDIK